MNIYDYIRQDVLENIHSRFGNRLGVVANPNVNNENGKCFGKVLLLVSIKNKKKIAQNDIVEFRKDKIDFRAGQYDNKGRILCLLDPHWCRIYELKLSIRVPVKIQKTIIKNDGSKEYIIDTEYQFMNEKQFYKRRMTELLEDWTYTEVEAVKNLNKRFSKLKDFYRALNETAKNYRQPSDFLKKLRGEYNNIKKNIYREWDQLLLKHYKERDVDDDFDFCDMYSVMKKEEENSKVIPISRMIP